MKRLYGFILAMIILISGCDTSFMAENPDLEKSFKEYVHEDTLILSDITDFDWDVVFIMEPYTPYETILNEHGISNKKIETNIESLDDIILIIFCKDKQIVQYCNLPRYLFDEYFITSKKEKKDAIFIINNEKLNWRNK